MKQRVSPQELRGGAPAPAGRASQNRFENELRQPEPVTPASLLKRLKEVQGEVMKWKLLTSKPAPAKPPPQNRDIRGPAPLELGTSFINRLAKAENTLLRATKALKGFCAAPPTAPRERPYYGRVSIKSDPPPPQFDTAAPPPSAHPAVKRQTTSDTSCQTEEPKATSRLTSPRAGSYLAAPAAVAPPPLQLDSTISRDSTAAEDSSRSLLQTPGGYRRLWEVDQSSELIAAAWGGDANDSLTMIASGPSFSPRPDPRDGNIEDLRSRESSVAETVDCQLKFPRAEQPAAAAAEADDLMLLCPRNGSLAFVRPESLDCCDWCGDVTPVDNSEVEAGPSTAAAKEQHLPLWPAISASSMGDDSSASILARMDPTSRSKAASKAQISARQDSAAAEPPAARSLLLPDELSLLGKLPSDDLNPTTASAGGDSYQNLHKLAYLRPMPTPSTSSTVEGDDGDISPLVALKLRRLSQLQGIVTAQAWATPI